MKCDRTLDVRCLLTRTNWVTTLPSHSKKCSRMVHLDRRTHKHHVFPSSHKAQTRSGVCPRFKDTIMIATGLLHRLFTFAPLCKYTRWAKTRYSVTLYYIPTFGPPCIILQRSTKCAQCAHAWVWRMRFGVRIETYEHAVCHERQTYIYCSFLKYKFEERWNLGFKIDLFYSQECGNFMTII